MPILPDLYADPAQLVGQDAEPAFRLRNTGSGPAVLSEGLVGISGASIDQLNLAGTGAGNILAANATIGQQLIFSTPSRASGAVMKFTGGLISASSILATTGGVAGTYAARVVLPSGVFGWIPIYPNGAVTGAAVE